jgi:hypothetical protein
MPVGLSVHAGSERRGSRVQQQSWFVVLAKPDRHSGAKQLEGTME